MIHLIFQELYLFMNRNSIHGKNEKVPSKIYLFNSIWLHKMALAVLKAPPMQNEVIFWSWLHNQIDIFRFIGYPV